MAYKQQRLEYDQKRVYKQFAKYLIRYILSMFNMDESIYPRIDLLFTEI